MSLSVVRRLHGWTCTRRLPGLRALTAAAGLAWRTAGVDGPFRTRPHSVRRRASRQGHTTNVGEHSTRSLLMLFRLCMKVIANLAAKALRTLHVSCVKKKLPHCHLSQPCRRLRGNQRAQPQLRQRRRLAKWSIPLRAQPVQSEAEQYPEI